LSILVTDGEQRAALAVVRSLGRAGHRVYVCSGRRRSLAGTSRYAAAEARVPDPLCDADRFVDAVVGLAGRWRADQLLPITDASLSALLPARGLLSAVCIPCAELEAYRGVSDKALLLEEAAKVGISIPSQERLSQPEDREGLSETPLRFPIVVKPSRSVAGSGSRRAKQSVQHAADWRHLQKALDAYSPEAYPLLLQQRIVGPGVGIFLLLWEGRSVAVFAHRRIREKPPAGGVSVYRESIAADPDLVARSRALLERFGWRGVAMIEYKIDVATGTPYLMEINGRFWGSLQLAVDAGVDFPALLVSLAAGEHPPAVERYRTGVRSRWWWGDVDHLLARLRHSADRLALPPSASGRWEALRDFLVLWRPGDRSEILRLSDPWPFVRETIDWFRGR
jgi:predicted ATP-grasp superfamily ATP-dependent carboligase